MLTPEQYELRKKEEEERRRKLHHKRSLNMREPEKLEKIAQEEDDLKSLIKLRKLTINDANDLSTKGGLLVPEDEGDIKAKLLLSKQRQASQNQNVLKSKSFGNMIMTESEKENANGSNADANSENEDDDFENQHRQRFNSYREAFEKAARNNSVTINTTSTTYKVPSESKVSRLRNTFMKRTNSTSSVTSNKPTNVRASMKKDSTNVSTKSLNISNSRSIRKKEPKNSVSSANSNNKKKSSMMKKRLSKQSARPEKPEDQEVDAVSTLDKAETAAAQVDVSEQVSKVEGALKNQEKRPKSKRFLANDHKEKVTEIKAQEVSIEEQRRSEKRVEKYDTRRPSVKVDLSKVKNLSKPVKKKKEEWETLDQALKEAFWDSYTTMKGKYFLGYAIKGWRASMEDVMDHFYSFNANIPNLFAVYDGHGGDECSEFCKQYLLKRLAVHSDLAKDPKAAIADTFLSVDESYNQRVEKQGVGEMAGATATVIYVAPVKIKVNSAAAKKDGTLKSGLSTSDLYDDDNFDDDENDEVKEKAKPKSQIAFKFFCASVGDSRAIMVFADGRVVALSNDHNLKRKDELERVQNGNAEIRYDPEFNELLVYSSVAERGLNVTRTLGDKDFKPIVTSFPELTQGFLKKDCKYIVIASDGLWGNVKNEEVGRVLNEYGLQKGIKNLSDLANTRGCFDNCTVVGIDVPQMIETMQAHFAQNL